MHLKLAVNIKEMRLAKGITQIEMAKHLHVTPQSVSRWENDSAYPDVAMLPKIAKFFNVTLDELMLGQESSHCVYKRELNEALNRLHREESFQNRLRVCEILEVLTREKPREYITEYYSHLTNLKRRYGNINDATISAVREQLAKLIREAMGNERHLLLAAVIRCEDEEDLSLWKDFLPEGVYISRDDYLMNRYEQNGDVEKWEKVRQKAVFNTVCRLCVLLTGEKQGQAVADGVIKQDCFMPEKSVYYLLALKLCESFSDNLGDVFLPLRTIIQFGCARSLFWEGDTENGFAHLTATKALLEKMWQSRDNKLTGSTDYTESVEVILTDDSVVGAVLNIWKCESCIEFDCVREDKRFTEFFEYVDNIIPESGNTCATEFESMLDFIKNIDGYVAEKIENYKIHK